MERVIFHCDCNGFYASVEELLNPELKKVPMAVAGDPQSRHGIILAKNERAKKYHVQTAETIWSAKRKCPELICVSAHHRLYEEISRRVNEIYLQYTDLVDRFGIDESFLDVTGSLRYFGKAPRALADEIRARVREEIGITISVGVSFCKVLAKLGSDYQKPDATTVIWREDMEKIVYPLPVSDLLYAGKRTTDALHKLGIQTIGDLARADRLLLGEKLGKSGDQLWRYANGIDREPVASFYAPREIKSVGNGMTFPQDIRGRREIRAGIALLADSVAGRLRADGLKCRAVQVQIKDPCFKVIQRQKTLPRPTWLCRELIVAAMELIENNWNLNAPIRLLSVTGIDLVPAAETAEQVTLFEPPDRQQHEKLERLENAMATIRERYGKNSIGFGQGGEEDDCNYEKVP